jgi:MarR family transcriptional regulator, temperature-dependent positive regulator of motility
VHNTAVACPKYQNSPKILFQEIHSLISKQNQQKEEMRFRVLRLIESRPEISQRELADELGISLGQINYQLKALKERGLIKVGNFLRSDNKLAYVYLLTPKGVADKLSITKHFLERKRNEFALLKAELEELEQEAQDIIEASERTVNVRKK